MGVEVGENIFSVSNVSKNKAKDKAEAKEGIFPGSEFLVLSSWFRVFYVCSLVPPHAL
jgi:hypothetical protein